MNNSMMEQVNIGDNTQVNYIHDTDILKTNDGFEYEEEKSKIEKNTGNKYYNILNPKIIDDGKNKKHITIKLDIIGQNGKVKLDKLKLWKLKN
jgi:hypothetical protein